MAKKQPANGQLTKESAATYNEFKDFEGRRYTGMKVGRSHKWYYDKGEWKEKKITPDQWEIHYAVNKRRPATLRKAPACRWALPTIGTSSPIKTSPSSTPTTIPRR